MSNEVRTITLYTRIPSGHFIARRDFVFTSQAQELQQVDDFAAEHGLRLGDAYAVVTTDTGYPLQRYSLQP